MTSNRSPPPPTQTEGETRDLPEGMQGFTKGQILGERYQILELLGRGGMGEVWRAFDLKLRVEVALKALRPEFFKSERRLELLRQEVRAAREVMSPNVCRIFDLIEVDGRELVSMEYVDGATLLEVLQDRGPLELKEAQEIASQFLAGLEAIHQAGLVHRDVKPENIMLTRAGRVVVMDFGLARTEDSGAGTVAGTPAYMSPEQAAGLRVDARADVYSAGVVLAEMVSPEGIKSFESRQSLWEGVRSEPAKVPDTPWAPVVKKAVAKDREQRYNSAHTLIRALEDRTFRVEGAEDLRPYPGLASFTEEDAEYFFGREAEVEQMWRKLDRPHLLGIVGPSGSGKSSFIRAGLIPSAEESWAIATCTPGNAANASLRRALAPEIGSDPQAMGELAVGNADSTVSAYSRWRARHAHALLIVDQFEELFTLNSHEERQIFVELLERLALEADVFVLLSMRDDFLLRCRDHEPLEPIFSDLTALPTLAGSALRRALVQPAMKCGYRFEDDELVDEMLAEVEGERGALPLLAFAAARLWEKRDRENGLLTRETYHDIGGVGGALARHAEATIDRIGSEHIGIVRELFRNLVTAEGTRAVRQWDELLSVFSDSRSESAAAVLRSLVDSRLLTSYEVREEDREPTRRVEIVHESLLVNWPRLVGWQTQDADSARMRDELRQAARAWEEHDRHDDRLWTGTAFREYSVWRESYPGGLSELEEDFSRAMTVHASRRRRRQRVATVAAFVVLLAVLGVVFISRQQAIAEANRAEASKLVTLGRTVLEVDRTEALAYAIASLERADTAEGRRLALRALWAGPPATVLPENGESQYGLSVSPDGRKIAVGAADGLLQVFHRDGGASMAEEGQGILYDVFFSPDGDFITVNAANPDGFAETRVWETEGLRLLQAYEPPEPRDLIVDPSYGTFFGGGPVEPGGPSLLTETFLFEGQTGRPRDRELGRWRLRRYPLDGGPSEIIGEVEGTLRPVITTDLSHGLLATGIFDEIHLHHLDTFGHEPPRVIGRHPGQQFSFTRLAFDPAGERLAACDNGGTLRVWPLDGDGTEPERELVTPGTPAGTAFSPDGRWLAHASRASYGWLWDLKGPAFAEPLRLGVEATEMNEVAFTPDGRWLVATARGKQPYRLTLWPLSDRFPRILRSGAAGMKPESFRFHPDGSRLYAIAKEDDGSQTLLWWPLAGGAGIEPSVLFNDLNIWDYVVDSRGRFLIIASSSGTAKLPLDGSTPTVIEEIPALKGFELDPSGRYIAHAHINTPLVSILDLETGETWEIAVPEGENWSFIYFDSAGRLVLAGGGILSRWDPKTRNGEILVTQGIGWAFPLADGDRFLTSQPDTGLVILNLDDGSRTPLARAHRRGFYDMSPGWGHPIIATSYTDGEIRVGGMFSEEPHLFLGPEVGPPWIIVSPDAKWVGSQINEDAVYLWPIPDLSKRPLHLLPHAELLAKLKVLTNLRAMPDPDSHTGYNVTPDFSAYRGWAEVPEW